MKSNRRRPRGQQTLGRSSTRPSTRGSSGTTAPPAPCGTRGRQTLGRSSTRPSMRAYSRTPAPRGSGANAQLQPDQLTESAFTNLLDLIHDQVRAEIQAQQAGQEATTTHAGLPAVTETTGQQATTGQAAATTSQAHSTGAGMLIWGNWGELGWAPHWRVERGHGLCVCM